MKQLSVIASLVVGLLMLPVALAATAAAAAERVNVDPEGELSATNPAVQLLLSADLVEYGRMEGDPLALILAAKLRQQVGAGEIERAKESAGGSASDKASSDVFTVDSILDEARDLTGGNETLSAMIDDLAERKGKGRVGGPVRHSDRAEAGATDTYQEIMFEAHREAAVYLEGDGDSDLDLVVTDELGNVICDDRRYPDRALCRWQPRWTGPFTIEVRNRGDVWNGYQLYTN